MTTSVDAPDQPEPESLDEELGSPGLTFESGWLVGLLVGITVLLIFLRRRRRRKRRQVAATDSLAPLLVV